MAPLRPLARRWRYLPTSEKAPVWRALYLPLDLADRARRGERTLPPRWLRHMVGGNYEAVGREFAGHFVSVAGLRPGERVLDVGCGAGRMALPLPDLLGPDGSYDGFDIVPEAVAWCRDHITARHPNFRFRLLDVRNARYNPRGALSAREASFPYPDGAFDFAFATSVFTHLGLEEARRYLGECARVLRPGGRLLATFFLLERESLALIAAGRSEMDFRHGDGDLRTLIHRPGDADFAVAFDEALVRRMIGGAGLALREPIHRGAWCGREDFLSYQDVVLADKPAGA